MSTSRPERSGKKFAPTPKNLARRKYQDKGVRLLARFLLNEANVATVASSLAVLYLESLDRLMNLSTQLDLTCRDQASKPDLQWKERVRRLRLTLRLEKERVHLLGQIIGGILGCLGGTQRLIHEAINKTNASPCEVDPDEARRIQMAVSIARIVVERCWAYKMELPEFLQKIVRGSMDAKTIAAVERDGLLRPEPDNDKEGDPK